LLTVVKKHASKKLPKTKPFENRRDWIMFSGFARMRVWNSGGPIHDPHERVLQLLIKPWDGDDESWTVYRHATNARKPGKLVFKKWDCTADGKKFVSLGKRRAPKKWRDATSVVEKRYPLPGPWVKALERKIETLSVPPIAGSVLPLARATEYTLSLWRSRQEAEFSWNPSPPWRGGQSPDFSFHCCGRFAAIPPGSLLSSLMTCNKMTSRKGKGVVKVKGSLPHNRMS
jgi:hypothetical protein